MRKKQSKIWNSNGYIISNNAHCCIVQITKERVKQTFCDDVFMCVVRNDYDVTLYAAKVEVTFFLVKVL